MPTVPVFRSLAGQAAFLRFSTSDEGQDHYKGFGNASCARAALPRAERCVAVDAAVVMAHYKAGFWNQLSSMCQSKE